MANEDPPDKGPENGSGDAVGVPEGAGNAAPGPALHVVPGPAGATGNMKKRGKLVPFLTTAHYEALWVAYRDGIRTARGLSIKCGVVRKTAERAISRGWPDRQWPALADRVREMDRVRELAEKQAQVEKFREGVDPLYKARRRNLEQAGTAGEVLFNAIRKSAAALEAATYIRYRRVLDVVRDEKGVPIRNPDGSLPNNGQPVYQDKPYVPADRVVGALRAASTAIRDLGTFERVWLQLGYGDLLKPGHVGEPGAPAPADEGGPIESPMTPAQWKWMVDNGGKLPEGCTDAQFEATLKYVYSTRRTGKGT